MLGTQMNITSSAPNAEIQDLRTLPTWNTSLFSLTLPAPEAGNFVELLLLKREKFRTDSSLNESEAIDLRDKWVPVTTAWRVLRFRMEERPPKWMVATNILNKQSRTADKGWSSSLGVGRGANNSSPWNVSCYETSTGASDMDRSSKQRIGTSGGHLWMR
jgi:hypothetical protein